MASPRKAASTKSVALILGGGAPNATLMAGSLEAFLDRNVRFEVISTAGAGALIGLLYAAPQSGDPRAALRSLIDMGVDDTIYARFPVNYKVFNKPGQLADLWRQLIAANPWVNALRQRQDDGEKARFLSDWTQLILASLCPSDLSPTSTGLCAHVPFIEEIVDFAALGKSSAAFYLNAYNLSKHHMECWDKAQIGKEQFLAALSFPFIYPPYLLDGDYYIEGAALDTLNFKSLYQRHTAPIDSVVVFDVLGCEHILHPPTDLYDAWVQSIITPLIELARDDLKLFEALHNVDPATGKQRSEVLRVNYEAYLSADDFSQELAWSHSNLARLYDIGYEAGHAFCSQHAAALGLP
ncbi:MAG: patatin-like phospholipase family protein [Paludibacterium sp.]|uniref:patatin-like phospholipase family protein n=1 Tax=Paludibacterium sp. TaxID=1917523 RepID=UPI0025EB86B3|nr:patatin-like phospholipase family protein [Paludibacterium sp.]MBV8046753.1 patatin-like phospholipase family protein [Paludibacterium sp.]MBV8648860.1 patatin-like phospholipase family protein [Paludibacterium sp.]